MSDDEAMAITELSFLQQKWPKNFWIFCAQGKLFLMRRGADGRRVYLPSGGVDQDCIVQEFEIPSDGGDW